MQRYMAGDFPRQEQQQRQQPGTARPPLYHAVQLGAYVLEQRGREGASAYASALLPVLPYDMIQGMCRQLGIAAPEKPKPLPPQEGEENSPASAAFVPGAAGLAVAGEVILDLLEKGGALRSRPVAGC